jgi:hypothetical protein
MTALLDFLLEVEPDDTVPVLLEIKVPKLLSVTADAMAMKMGGDSLQWLGILVNLILSESLKKNLDEQPSATTQSVTSPVADMAEDLKKRLDFESLVTMTQKLKETMAAIDSSLKK